VKNKVAFLSKKLSKLALKKKGFKRFTTFEK
jgi:hypothetical protein